MYFKMVRSLFKEQVHKNLTKLVDLFHRINVHTFKLKIDLIDMINSEKETILQRFVTCMLPKLPNDC